MSTNTSNETPPKPRFRVGQWVAYASGFSRHVAEIVEDVGLVGLNRRRFYRLREPIWYGEPVEFELPETSLEPATLDDYKRRYPPEQQPPSPYDLPREEYE